MVKENLNPEPKITNHNTGVIIELINLDLSRMKRLNSRSQRAFIPRYSLILSASF
jgi:hypothetical protein